MVAGLVLVWPAVASLYNHFNLERHLVARQIYKLRRVAAQLACGLVAA